MEIMMFLTCFIQVITLQVSVFPDPAGPEGAPPSFMLRALINVLIALSVNGVITKRFAFPKYSKP